MAQRSPAGSSSRCTHRQQPVQSLPQKVLCRVTWKAHLDAGTQPPGSDANGWEIESTNRSGLFKRLKKAPDTTWHHRWVPRRRAFIAFPLAEGPHRPVQEVCPSAGDGEGPRPPPPPPLSLQAPAFSRGWSRPRPRPADIPPITARAADAGCPGRCRGAAPNSWRPVNTVLI